MPELPEVETVARDLRPLVSGAVISGVRCDWPRTIRGEDEEAFAETVIGRTMEGTGRRAKLLLVHLSGDLVIAIHLKMTGQLFVVPRGTPQDRHVHLVLELADGRELRFRDMRKFGRVGVYPRVALEGGAVARDLGGGHVFELGPEPLDPAFTRARFRAQIAGRRGRLKSLLTDQAFIAGIGNIYADEALWSARLHPLRSAGSLRRDDLDRLHAAITSVLTEAIAFRGSSIDDYTAPEGDGSMQERLQVYQRAGEPCPRCARPVRRVVLGARSTHFCSWCQRLPAADRTGATKILATASGGAHRGPRWTQIAGEGAVGLTRAEAADAARLARTDRARRAAATRRRAAREAGTPSAHDAPSAGGAA